MNILRVIIDGIFMSAVFNLSAGLLVAINPVIFTTSYPKKLQEIAPKNPHATKHQLLWMALVVAPVDLFGIFSTYMQGIEGFWTLFLVGYIQWFIINLGDFFGLDLYLREKLGERWELPLTHGHPLYQRKEWMKNIALVEHWVMWPFIICPLAGFINAGVGMLLLLL